MEAFSDIVRDDTHGALKDNSIVGRSDPNLQSILVFVAGLQVVACPNISAYVLTGTKV